MNILGVSALYHDSAAALLQRGDITAAAQEERFTRVKFDARLPQHAIAYCLREGGVGRGQLDALAFYDKPLTKFARFLSTHGQIAPFGWRTFSTGVPAWLRDKAWVAAQLDDWLDRLGVGRPKRHYFPEHHLSHAASAFYPSPFKSAAVLTIDGVGEWACSTICRGEGATLTPLVEQRFPHSLGLLYAAFTYFCGFRINSGEYKLMGLAPYGEPVYVDTIKQHLVTIRPDGSIRLNLDYFGFLDDVTMTNSRFAALFGGPPRQPESALSKREMNLARSIQEVTEEIVVAMARYARAITGADYLCLAGGVALNCVATGKLLGERIFKDLWIQPAAGDAGGALGAGLYVWHEVLKQPRVADGVNDRMGGALLGPRFGAAAIREFLTANRLPFEELSDEELAQRVARAVAEEQIVGVLRGRMEYGPRALGARSILADARSVRMQSRLNLATKFRESFRPFAPIVLAEDVGEFFQTVRESPYMLLVDQLRPERRLPAASGSGTPGAASTVVTDAELAAWVNQPRSDIPAVTHVDYSARLQTVDTRRNPWLHRVLSVFKAHSGMGVMVNTSFNVRSEPIVCTPEDAYRCFMRCGMDALVLENFWLKKSAQPAWEETRDWRQEFGLD